MQHQIHFKIIKTHQHANRLYNNTQNKHIRIQFQGVVSSDLEDILVDLVAFDKSEEVYTGNTSLECP